MTLDAALEHIGVIHNSSVFTIEVDHCQMEFAGWISVVGENSHLTLVREIQ
jgi:hypothetical protein